MELGDVAKKRNELRATINNLIGEFVKETGCSVEIEVRRYQEIGRPFRPVVEIQVIVP